MNDSFLTRLRFITDDKLFYYYSFNAETKLDPSDVCIFIL